MNSRRYRLHTSYMILPDKQITGSAMEIASYEKLQIALSLFAGLGLEFALGYKAFLDKCKDLEPSAGIGTMLKCPGWENPDVRTLFVQCLNDNEHDENTPVLN